MASAVTADVGQSLLDLIEWLIRLPVTIFHGYSSLIRAGADFVHSLFERYGYWVIFFGTLSENTLLLGLIVPGAFVVVLAGLSVHDGSMSIPIAVALGVLGTIIGDTISYCLGRYGYVRLAPLLGLGDFAEKVREPILRRGVFFVLLYHFAGYTRVVGPAGAGILQMPFRRWAPADYTGATLWICTYMAIGYGLGMLGFTLDSSDKWFRYIEYGLLVIVLAWGLYMYRSGLKTLAGFASESRAYDGADRDPVAAETSATSRVDDSSESRGRD